VCGSLTGPRKGGEEAAGADSRTVVVDIPDNLALRHEWLEEERDYRQFLIPAGLVNRYLMKFSGRCPWYRGLDSQRRSATAHPNFP
jgi:hypothetical protein